MRTFWGDPRQQNSKKRERKRKEKEKDKKRNEDKRDAIRHDTTRNRPKQHDMRQCPACRKAAKRSYSTVRRSETGEVVSRRSTWGAKMTGRI
jgi:hypothetical protein